MLHEFGILLKALITAGGLAAAVVRAQEVQPRTVLIESVRIFDGKGSTLSAPSEYVRISRLRHRRYAPSLNEHGRS